MTDQVNKVEQLEQTIAQLKIRIFDTNEQLNGLSQENTVFKNALAHIANLVGLNDANTTVQQLVDAVTAIVPAQKEAEFEPVVEG